MSRPKHQTDDEYGRLIRAALERCPRDYVLLHLCGMAGLRVGELVQVRFEDFDLNAMTLLVNTEKQKHPTIDALHVQPAVRPLIEWYSATCGRTSGYLFPGEVEGTHLTTRAAQNVYYACCKAAGIPIARRSADEKGRGIHSLRHRYASKLFEKPGVTDLDVMNALRDRSLSAAATYFCCQQEAEWVEKCGAMWGRVRKTVRADIQLCGKSEA